jgi:hypothetical protein
MIAHKPEQKCYTIPTLIVLGLIGTCICKRKGML